MPIGLQKRVLSHLIGYFKAQAWENLLVGKGFHVVEPNKKTYEVYYKAGQPMGAYSS